MQYDKKLMQRQAENLEKYLEVIDEIYIIDGITKEQYEDAKKTVRKLIKHLKNGDGDKVYNKEEYIKLIESGRL